MSRADARHGGVVLLYHRIADVACDSHHLCVPPAAFASQVAHLSQTCHPIALERLVEGALAGTLLPRSVAVTFDDGYHDTIQAVDALVAANIPASLFLTSAHLDHGRAYHYWWDLLEWAVMTPDLGTHELQVPLPDGVRSFRLDSEGDRAASHRALHRALLPLDEEARDLALAPILSFCESRRPVLPRRMTGAEVAEISRRPGIRIGAHTDDHLFLPAQAPERQREQIASNLGTLERLLGVTITTLAYPFGASTPETEAIAGALGIEIAVTTAAFGVTEGCRLLSIPRVDVAAISNMPFEERLDAIFARMVQC
jgi:peptidoglycan/xylan/chitin deacetylase (PgdA/CDA1 family)